MQSSMTLLAFPFFVLYFNSFEVCTGYENNGLSQSQNASRILKPMTEDCTLGLISVAHDSNVEEDTIVCCFGSFSYPIEFYSSDQKDQVANLINSSGGLNNNEFILNLDDSIHMSINTFSHTADRVVLPPNFDTLSIEKRASVRRLVTATGNRTVLVVRVIDADGKVHSDGAAEMSDNIFGTSGDLVNLKSQMNACSYGKINIVNDYNFDISAHLQAPGVIEVTSSKRLAFDDRYTVHNDVTAQVQTLLGVTLPGPFDHVMYVLESCYVSCFWAYSFYNQWMSVFQGAYYSMAAFQMHHIGHNLGLGRSGGIDGVQQTSDGTCLMGNPLFSDDIGQMCFNPAKSWHIDWYSDRQTEIDIQPADVYHEETLVGISDYGNNAQQRNVIIKLENGLVRDYFIGFNRAIGINSDNVEADDEVTIIEESSLWLQGQTYLRAHLAEGESYVVTGGALITVTNINTSVSPGTATVRISKGTMPLTLNPSAVPSGSPMSPPTTENLGCKILCCYPIDNNGDGGWANENMLNHCQNQNCQFINDYCSGSGFDTCVQNNCAGPSPSSTPAPTPCSDGGDYAHRKQMSRTCSWLAEQPQDKVLKMCERKTKYFQFNGYWTSPAHEVCKFLCGSCDPCHQIDYARFYLETNDFGQHVIKTCSWLKNLDDNDQIQNICQSNNHQTPYPRARDACPETCTYICYYFNG